MSQRKLVEKIKTNTLNSIFLENHAVYETMWKNMVQSADDNIIWCMRFACRINKARM